MWHFKNILILFHKLIQRCLIYIESFYFSLNINKTEKAEQVLLQNPRINISSKDNLDLSLFFSDEIKQSIVHEAEKTYNHIFNLLGSGNIPLGLNINWHADFKTGHTWDPKIYHKLIRPAPYPGGYDIKVPWELSRCQHFVRLGQAYWLTNDEKYPQEFCNQVQDWIEQNPPKFGVNWACTMDVAIRAVNWLWSYYFFKDSPSINNEFRLSFYKSLLIHGRHIRSNLENKGEAPNNHYLSNLVGLIYLGILCPQFQEATEWLNFGLGELWKETRRQFFPDGVNFEASIAYHRLSTELVLSTVILCRHNSISAPEDIMQRIEKMLEFVMYYTKPDGSVPLIGDADNGRLHRLSIYNPPEREWTDHRYLLAIGAVVFERDDFAQAAGDQWQDALWLLGEEAILRKQNFDARKFTPPLLQSKGFLDSGFFILRDQNIYIFVELGHRNQEKKNGHAHNNCLGFEIFLNNHTWFSDSGTYTYTSDYETRNRYRATSAHNTIQVDDEEQNFINARYPFSIMQQTQPELLDWRITENVVILDAQHYGYKKLHEPVIHRRKYLVDLTKGEILIQDFLIGKGKHKIVFSQIIPEDNLFNVYNQTTTLKNGKNICTIRCATNTDLAITQIPIFISPSYGAQKKALKLAIEAQDIDLQSNNSIPIFEMTIN